MVDIDGSTPLWVLGAALVRQRPAAEVVFAHAENLYTELDRFRPHLVVAGEVSESVKNSGAFWVALDTEELGAGRSVPTAIPGAWKMSPSATCSRW